MAFPSWEWAEIDAKRLVWAENGCLGAGRLSTNGLADVKTLFDFNAMTFSPVEAPY